MLIPINELPEKRRNDFDPNRYPELHAFCVDMVLAFDTSDMDFAEISGWPEEISFSDCARALFYAVRTTVTYHDISVEMARYANKLILSKDGLTLEQRNNYA